MVIKAPAKELQIGEWLPILNAEARPFVKRILDWKLKHAQVFYRLIGPVHWIEHEAQPEEDMPPTLGWKVDVEEIS
jgi:hypothetical protein